MLGNKHEYWTTNMQINQMLFAQVNQRQQGHNINYKN